MYDNFDNVSSVFDIIIYIIGKLKGVSLVCVIVSYNLKSLQIVSSVFLKCNSKL
jgi:hypothetical protein